MDPNSGNRHFGPDALGGRMDELSGQTLVRFFAVIAISLFFASMTPPALVAATFSSLLFLGALASATIATLIGEAPLARHLTRWDEAAALLGASMIAGWMVDPIAVDATMQQLEAAVAGS